MSVPCIACNGSGKRGIYDGYTFPCPYCDGRKIQPTEEDNVSVGKRCGKIYSARLKIEPGFIESRAKKVW